MSIRRRSFGFRNVIALLIGDLAVLFGFIWLGRVSHELTTEIREIAVSTAPFAIAWLVIGILTGAFTARAVRSAGTAVYRAAQTWFVAAPWAFVARSIYLETPVVFAFAGLTFSGILIGLVVWRMIYALIVSR